MTNRLSQDATLAANLSDLAAQLWKRKLLQFRMSGSDANIEEVCQLLTMYLKLALTPLKLKFLTWFQSTYSYCISVQKSMEAVESEMAATMRPEDRLKLIRFLLEVKLNQMTEEAPSFEATNSLIKLLKSFKEYCESDRFQDVLAEFFIHCPVQVDIDDWDHVRLMQNAMNWMTKASASKFFKMFVFTALRKVEKCAKQLLTQLFAVEGKDEVQMRTTWSSIVEGNHEKLLSLWKALADTLSFLETATNSNLGTIFAKSRSSRACSPKRLRRPADTAFPIRRTLTS